MAVPNPNKYLTNMAGGKTSMGGVANAGQQSWAKAQLAKVTNPNQSSAANAGGGLKPVVNKPVPNPNGGTPVNTMNPPQYNPVPNPNVAATSPVTAPTSPQASEFSSWKTKQAELFSKLEGLSNAQFSYNPETDPGYIAQRNLAQLRAGDATKSALETQNSKGLLQSTMTNSQLGQIEQRAEQEAQAYIPQYREQAYGQFQDRLKSAGDLLGTARNLGNDEFNQSYSEAQLTGTYQSPEARQQIDALLELKRQAEAPGVTAEQRAGLSKQADGIRSRLTSLGVDIANLGANTNSSKANAAAGVRTLAASTQDYNEAADQRDFEYTAGQDKIKDEQFEKEFQRKVEQDGIQNAISWANNAISQRNSNISAGNLALSQDKFAYDQTQDAKGGKNYNYENDPEFATDVQWINDNPDTALAELKAKSSQIIAQYGKDAYDDLISYATPKKKSSTDLFADLFSPEQ